MLFNSYSFVFMFLPASIVGFFVLGSILGNKLALAWLVFCSVIFYVYWDPGYWWVLVLTASFNYSIGRLLLSIDGGKRKKILLWVGVLANVIFLAWFKLKISPFFAGLVEAGQVSLSVFNNTRDIYIPLAISFITFQQIVFIVDCYKNRCVSSKLPDYLLFITFFPQLVMGPIVHQKDIIHQFRSERFFRFDRLNFSIGLSIFIIGLFKKVVLADSISVSINDIYAAAVMGESINLIDAWIAAVGFIFQLYFDFSGYADMAIGIAKMLNINLPINFNAPLRARNRFEYWRNWHITFSEFMKNHVYMPLVRKRTRYIGRYTALFISTFLSGLWHGVGVTFVLWGAVQGAIMVFSHAYKRKRIKSGRYTEPSRGLAIAVTFLSTVFLGVLFRSANIDVILNIYSGMLGVNGVVLPAFMAGVLESVGVLHTGDATSLAWIVFDNLLARPSDLFWLAVLAIVVFMLPTTREYFGTYWTALDVREEGSSTSGMVSPARLRFELNIYSAFLLACMLMTSLYFMLESSRFIYYQF